MVKQYAYVLAALLSAITFGACHGGHDYPVPEPEEEDDTYVNLCISVAANNSVASGSRSRSETEFMAGTKPYEDINSLRVIMVNEGTVEYNEYIKGPDGKSAEYVSNINMRTSPGGERQIYLIANEAVIPQLIYKGPESEDPEYDNILASIVPKQKLSVDLENIILTSGVAGKPLFDDGHTYVPMTEIFTIKIKDTDEITQYPFTQYAELFVTRAAVKFSFIVITNRTTSVTSPDTENVTTPNNMSLYKLGTDYRISKFSIRSTANCEYLFPKKAEYFPYKYETAANREITSFQAPEAETAIASFSIPDEAYAENSNYFSTVSEKDQKYGILEKDDRIFSFTPAYYFPETRLSSDGKFTMDVTIDWLDGTENTVLDDIELSSLTDGMLPRNTHVLVILSMGEYTLNATVTLVPYIGVELDPSFGFDALVPGNKTDDPDPDAGENENE